MHRSSLRTTDWDNSRRQGSIVIQRGSSYWACGGRDKAGCASNLNAHVVKQIVRRYYESTDMEQQQTGTGSGRDDQQKSAGCGKRLRSERAKRDYLHKWKQQNRDTSADSHKQPVK